MEPLEYFEVLERLYGLDDVVRETITKVKTNKEQCKLLQKQIDTIMKPAERMRHRVAYSEDLKTFIDDMTRIMKSTEEVVTNLTKVNLAQKVVLGRKYENQVNGLIRRFIQISKSQVFQGLAKIYSEKPLKSASFSGTWELAFNRACLFCHVTDEGHIIVGGQCPGKENTYQIRAFDAFGNDVWHWQCLEELGEPSDITQVMLKDPRNENQHFLAIVTENQGVRLFDPEIRSITPDPAFTVSDPEYRVRRIVRLVSPQRIVVSLDPSITASSGLTSQLKVLSCDKVPFTETWTMKLDCIDTLALSALSHEEVAVVCARPDTIAVYNVSTGTPMWQLHPTTIQTKQVVPHGLCTIGGEICVYDESDPRILAARNGQWGAMLLRGLGERVYSIAWDPHIRKIVVVHDRDGSHRITLFDIQK